MKKFFSLLLCLCLLLSSLAVGEVDHSLKDREHKAMHMIVMFAPERDSDGKLDGGQCTAYAVAPHVLLTAQHCDYDDGILFIDPSSPEDVKAGKVQSYGVTEKVFDGADHMLLVVPGITFTDFITYDPLTYHAPVQGEHLYFWGNPRGVKDQYREGYVMGTFPTTKDDDVILPGQPIITIFMVAVGGDSGSAIFDADTGAVVAVVTYGMAAGSLTGVYPLQFKQSDVLEAVSRRDAVPAPRTLPSPPQTLNSLQDWIHYLFI